MLVCRVHEWAPKLGVETCGHHFKLAETCLAGKMTRHSGVHSVAPPYQLIRGDTYNLTLGVVIAVILAACKVRAARGVSMCTAHPHPRVGHALH